MRLDISNSGFAGRDPGAPRESSPPKAYLEGLRRLEQLRRFAGPPKVFWHNFLEVIVLISGARLGVLVRNAEAGSGPWQTLVMWPGEQAGREPFLRSLESLADTAVRQEFGLHRFNETQYEPDFGLAFRVDSESRQELFVVALDLPGCSEAKLARVVDHVRLTRDTPLYYRLQRNTHELQTALSQSSSVLDLMALLNAQHRFLAVAMTVCNELAARHQCARVSLGWIDREYIRLQAISHTEKFERKMEAVKTLEQAMEESFDQDEAIFWPAAEGESFITQAHANLAEIQKVKFLCSVPWRLNGEPVAVITCERNTEPFAETEVRLLNLYAEMAVRRLSDLKRADRWFGARWATALREGLAKLVGVRHTWAKVIAALVAVGLGILFFGRMTYRVEAPFILRTDDQIMLSAPFNGYIAEVPIEVGEPVKAGGLLLQLDKRDLLLEEAGSVADLARYSREAEKARASNALADMNIAQAQAEQARVRLELVRYRLSQAGITSPFDGVVVEGDLKKRLGAPVKQGDLLFRLARLEKLYVQCDVAENDIHEVRGDASGEIAFASQPKLKFPIRVQRIEPAAQAKEKGNMFIVRCQFQEARQGWWRPGMSGIAKLNVGKRTFCWILTHRTVDFLRMYFWW